MALGVHAAVQLTAQLQYYCYGAAVVGSLVQITGNVGTRIIHSETEDASHVDVKAAKKADQSNQELANAGARWHRIASAALLFLAAHKTMEAFHAKLPETHFHKHRAFGLRVAAGSIILFGELKEVAQRKAKEIDVKSDDNIAKLDKGLESVPTIANYAARLVCGGFMLLAANEVKERAYAALLGTAAFSVIAGPFVARKLTPNNRVVLRPDA